MILKYGEFINELFDTPKPSTTKQKDYNDAKKAEYDAYYNRLDRDYNAIYTHKDFQKIWKILERDCEKFLKEIRYSGSDLLFRGVSQLESNAAYGMDKRRVRKDRQPKDMYKNVHELFDSKFMDKFGAKLRSSGAFTTKDPLQASVYSNYSTIKKRKEPFLFFPKGDYRYFWNPDVDDLYTKIEFETWYYKSDYLNSDHRLLDLEFDEQDWFKIYGNPNQDWNEFSNIKRIRPYHNIKGGGKGKFIDEKWIPEKSFDEYLEDVKKQIKIDLENNTTKLVEGYREGGISEVTHQEVTFMCDEYYLVDDSFLFKILKKIKKI